MSSSVLKDVEGSEDGPLHKVLNVKRELRNHIFLSSSVVPISTLFNAKIVDIGVR